MAQDFFRDLVDDIKDSDTNILGDGKNSAEFGGYIDTGCLILNGLISAKLQNGGMADTKILGLAAESSTGKTFIALGIVKSFLDQNPNGGVVYFDTEAAVTSDMFKQRGIDPRRVIVSEPDTLQKFKTTAVNIIDKYMAKPEKTRPPMMFVLDSLGMLSSSKEMEDTAAGKDTRDMTKAQLVRAIFRVLTLKLSKARIPMIVTNHVYAAVGCAETGTLVETTEGLKEIQDIRIGDTVPTMVGPKPVTNIFTYDTDELYELELQNGQILRLTGGHKLMLQTGDWKKVEDLVEGDVVISVGS